MLDHTFGFIVGFVGFIYVVGAFCSAYVNTIEYKNDYKTHAPLTPKTAWQVVLWPIFFVLIILRSVAILVHYIFSLILLLMFVEYNKTATYKKINDWLNDW